nr:MAG TPA: hypothetical protein [Caudoviricetes sp.]
MVFAPWKGLFLHSAYKPHTKTVTLRSIQS